MALVQKDLIMNKHIEVYLYYTGLYVYKSDLIKQIEKEFDKKLSVSNKNKLREVFKKAYTCRYLKNKELNRSRFILHLSKKSIIRLNKFTYTDNVNFLKDNGININNFSAIELRSCDIGAAQFAQNLSNFTGKNIIAADDYYYFGNISSGPSRTIRKGISEIGLLLKLWKIDMIQFTPKNE